MFLIILKIRFPLQLTDLEVYVNEEKTRTFLGIIKGL